MSAILVEGLVKDFGKVKAVDGLGFAVEAGQVVGFIGANGAGKTTTMRMMVTLDHPDAGKIFIAGHDAVERPGEVRRRVGWMPDAYAAYSRTSVLDYLDFVARAHGFVGAERHRRVQQVVDFTELGELRERDMDKLSKGQSQRVCLAQALIHDPDVLVLDEPAAGLDPKARNEFKRLVRVLAEANKTLFISSHILSELGEMCDALIFIDAGRIVYQGAPEGMARHAQATLLEVRILGPIEPLLAWIELQPELRLLDAGAQQARLQVEPNDDATLSEVLLRAVRAGLPLVEFRREQARLDDAFVAVLEATRRGKQ